MDIVVKGGTLVLGEGVFPADVGIIGEKVAVIGQSLDSTEVIDARGCLVLPGGIDPHTHLALTLGPDLAVSDDFSTGSIAAACGSFSDPLRAASTTNASS